MTRRTRFLAGVISTPAFLFLLAWGVQASMCAAEVELGGAGMAHEMSSGVAQLTDSGVTNASMPGHDCESAHGTDAGMPHCPMLLTGSTCQTSSSLPAALATAQSATEGEPPFHLVQTEQLLLLTFELFRPPRA